MCRDLHAKSRQGAFDPVKFCCCPRRALHATGPSAKGGLTGTNKKLVTHHVIYIPPKARRLRLERKQSMLNYIERMNGGQSSSCHYKLIIFVCMRTFSPSENASTGSTSSLSTLVCNDIINDIIMRGSSIAANKLGFFQIFE